MTSLRKAQVQEEIRRKKSVMGFRWRPSKNLIFMNANSDHIEGEFLDVPVVHQVIGLNNFTFYQAYRPASWMHM